MPRPFLLSTGAASNTPSSRTRALSPRMSTTTPGATSPRALPVAWVSVDAISSTLANFLLRSRDEDDEKQDGDWIVGLYNSTIGVLFKFLESEDEARALYSSETSSSRVLLHREQLVLCSTAWWDSKGLGVAVLLHGPRKWTNKSLSEIESDLETGKLPFVPPDRTPVTQNSLKFCMRLAFHRQSVTYFGTSPYKEESLCFFDVQQHPRVQKRIALTIDDAPCRFPQHEASQVSCVKALLQKYKAKATFMVVGSWCNQPEHRNDMISLLKEGHELGNHCMLDRSYEFDSPRVFGIAVDECSAIIQDLQTAAGLSATGVKWFRAPHGRFTQDMAQVLARRGLVNTMCDTYASCPIVQDPDFIAAHLTQTCQDGSILLIHMPEKHVRQWCLAALEKLLQGLQERGFRAVTVGEMARLAQFDPHQEPHQSIGFHRRNSMGTSLVKARGRVRSNSSLRSRRRSVST